METPQIILITGTSEQIADGINQLLKKHQANLPEMKFEDEKMTREQAMKLTGESYPTFRKRVAAGIYKAHGHGRKVFFIRSEIIQALKDSEAINI